MIDFISGEFKKIVCSMSERYAKKMGGVMEDYQLALQVDDNSDEESNVYVVMKNYVPIDKINFLGVLGVRIDFKGYSRIAPQFIEKSIRRLSWQNNIDLNKMTILCCPYLDDGKKKVDLFMYDGLPPNGKYVEKTYDNEGRTYNGIPFSSLFDLDDIEMPT